MGEGGGGERFLTNKCLSSFSYVSGSGRVKSVNMTHCAKKQTGSMNETKQNKTNQKEERKKGSKQKQPPQAVIMALGRRAQRGKKKQTHK